MKAELTFAYVAEGNARDVHTWSGTTFFIARALEKQDIKLVYIDNLNKRGILERVFGKIYSKLVRMLTGKQFQRGRTVRIAKKYARKIERRLPEEVDVIFIPSGTIPMAFLRSDKKKIIYNDATFAAMIDYYPEFSGLCSKTLREGAIIEKAAFENADLLLFSSDWAAQSAIRDYEINSAKIKVIPFGANIEKEQSEDEIQRIVENRCDDIDTGKCRLLFIGVDWERKGGNIALEIAKELHSRNIEVHLDIIGVKNIPVTMPAYVRSHGFVSKHTEEGRQRLAALFRDAHFFVLPTRQDCTPIVFSEAASFALPVITTKTGGVETAVMDGVNGRTFALSCSPVIYADYIARLINNRDEYKNLCLSSFDDYKRRLNWGAAGKQIVDAIKEIL